MSSVRILVADDHEVFRRGLRSLLESRSDWEICGEASNGADAVDKTKELRPDVVVMDITMPRLNGLQAAHLIRTQVPGTAIIILSQYEVSLMSQSAIDAGANAYVAKNQVSRDLLSAVETVTRKPPVGTVSPIAEVAAAATPGEFPVVRASCLVGGGEMGGLMRAKDWSRTALGDPALWPTALRLAVRIMLGSGYPMAVAWGSRFTFLYNDAYRPILARTKHPGALGRGIPEIFPEIWDFIGPMFERVLRDNEQTTLVDQLLVLDRKGFLEECYFTFSYSPITEDDGRVGGALITVIETTERVFADRRTKTMAALGERLASAISEAEICHVAAEVLGSNRDDFPFAYLYLVEDPSDTGFPQATLAASTGGAPIIGDQHDTALWPFAAAAQTGNVTPMRASQVLPSTVRTHLGDPVLSTATVALKIPGRDAPAGFLVTGINPRRELETEYQSLLMRAAADIATALAGFRALNAERRRAEALAELDRAKTSFFSNVSHEFRTPLTLMLGPLEELVAECGPKVEADRGQIDMVYRNGLRMLKLVNTLLDFSRIEAGRLLANYEATDLAILTQDLTSVFRSAVERAGLKLVVETPTLPEPVYVDRDMWEKIVLNLLSNALKFTASGEVRVTLKPSAEAVMLTVSDTGTGIPAKELPRIFDRFHRVENVRARTHEGSGIGLALVQELVRLHGGTIAARSQEGAGAEFTVQLPFGSAHLPQDRIRETRNLAATALGATPFVEEALRWLPEEAPRPSTKEFSQASHQGGPGTLAQNQRPARILVADDNADMRDYMRRLLGERYTVDVVDNGESALMHARQHPPDLVVSDIMMPRMTGIELLRALREDPVLNGVHVMLVSARAEAEVQTESLDSGADYLVKPFTSRELLARVGSHLRLARFQQSWAERERELRRQAELGRRRLEELFMQAPVAIAVLSGPEHRWTFANPEYLRLAGVEAQEDLLGKPIRETMAELEEQPFFDLLDQVYRFGVPYHGKEMKVVWKTEKPGRQLEGYFNFVYQPMRTSSGEVEGILVHTVDVTEQVQARHAVEQAQDQFRNFFRRAPVGAALIDFASSNILEINDTFLDMIGYTREEVVGKTTLWFTHPEDRERQVQLLAEYQAQPMGTFRIEKRYVCKDGRTIWVQTASNPVRDTQASQPMYSVAVAADITERKLAEAELRAAQETLEMRVRERTAEAARAEKGLRTLSARLLQVQDEERRRIARELHDSAGQMLVALDLDLYTVLHEASLLSPAGAEALERGLATVQEMSKELRTISHLLHPPLLDEAGLPSAIRWYVEGYADRSKIEVKLNLPSDLGRLSHDQELTIFRIVQESLTNIHRHSGSSTAEVSVARSEALVQVEIRDFGRGMPNGMDILSGGSLRPGVGVQGMRERVRQLGGRLEIRPVDPGTIVVASLPISTDAHTGSKAAEAN